MDSVKDILGQFSVRSMTPRHLRYTTDYGDNESAATSPDFPHAQRQLFNLRRPASRADQTLPSTQSNGQDHIHNHGHTHAFSENQKSLLAGPEYVIQRAATPFFSNDPEAASNPFFSASPSPTTLRFEKTRDRGRATPDERSFTVGRRGIRRLTKSAERSNSMPENRGKRMESMNEVSESKPGISRSKNPPIRPPRPEERALMDEQMAKNEILTIEEALACSPAPSAAIFTKNIDGESPEVPRHLQAQSPQFIDYSPARVASAANLSNTLSTQSPLRLRLKLRSSLNSIKSLPSPDKDLPNQPMPPFIAIGPVRYERVPNIENLDEWWSSLDEKKKMAAKEIFETLTGLFDSTYPCLIPTDAEEGVYHGPADR